MSAATDALDAVGIVNPHQYATALSDDPKVGAPYIAYVAYDPTQRRTAGWRVHRPGHCTNPTSRDYREPDKVFPTYAARMSAAQARAATLAQAQEWAGARYGITVWARTPFGTYMDAEHVAEMKRRYGPLSDAQRVMLANLRDDGDVRGRHGQLGKNGGGNDRAFFALAGRGLINVGSGTTPTALTEIGRAVIGEAKP